MYLARTTIKYARNVPGMARLCPVPLWRCTAVKPLSGTLLTHYLCLVFLRPLSPLQTPGTNWGELVLIMPYPQSCTHQSASPMSVWKTLPDDTLLTSGAASLSGNLLAVGGGEKGSPFSPAVYVFLPLTNSWVRATGNLPEAHGFFFLLQYSYHPIKC